MLSRFRLLPDAAQRLCWVLLALAIAVLPHLQHLPVWLVAIAAATCGWRLLIELKGWNLPPRLLRTAVACGMLACVAIGYRTLNGLEAGTAFLVLLAGAKLLETRGTRDLTMLVFVSYVLLFAAFLLAVFIVGVVAGAPAAGFALLLSIPVVWWAFVPPFFMFNPLTIADAHDIDLFFLFGALLIGIADLYRQSLNILTRTRLKTGDHSVAPNSR